jgi:hypothetical protein
LAEDNGTPQPPRPADAPRFDTARLRTAGCDLVSVVPAPDGVDLWFGLREPRDHCPGSTGAAPSLRIRLASTAARHLEEVLSRVIAAPGTDGGGGGRK